MVQLIISVKVFEVKAADIREVLMPVSSSSTQNADPTVQVHAKKKPQARKPGRPMTTHRKDDEELFKHLRNNPEGIGVERKEWQIAKWNKFKSG